MLFVFFRRFCWLWILVLIQALILNNIQLFGYATPFLYVYLLLKFNVDTSRYSLLLWGFCLGLAVDIFTNTPGVNAAATVLLAFVCPFLVWLFSPRDSSDNFSPGIRSMGTIPFLKYVVLALLVHQTALFVILTFSFTHFFELLIRIVSCTLITTLCIWSIENVKR